MILSRPPLFTALRTILPSHSLTSAQIRGIDTLIDAWNSATSAGATANLNEPAAFAYVLAGVAHETAGRMFPVREGVYMKPWGREDEWTDDLAKAFIAKHHYPYAKLYNGVMYYGRGRIQNTWDGNYMKLATRFKVDLVTYPNLLITDWALDAKVTVYGHIEGLWSGHGLIQYFRQALPPNPTAARHIVNGVDQATAIAAKWTKILLGVRESMGVA